MIHSLFRIDKRACHYRSEGADGCLNLGLINMATRMIGFTLPPGITLNMYQQSSLQVGMPVYQWLMLFGDGQGPIVLSFLQDLTQKIEQQMSAAEQAVLEPAISREQSETDERHPTERSPAPPSDAAPVVTVPKGGTVSQLVRVIKEKRIEETDPQVDFDKAYDYVSAYPDNLHGPGTVAKALLDKLEGQRSEEITPVEETKTLPEVPVIKVVPCDD